ncbi:DeoR/GlpR family DNA-binding transcription regulator [Nocardia seriolae]|uniref:Alkaline phosphatase n=1 Tax=Nocardia seriolae TaxID=37332 RepID=A0A0B8N3F4_9NOCA|nr:DeoR/GlpR family DNA-binding transcription regulator [Nocardia seriolae]APA96398.1 HTH-type transcriptional regulator GlpR [Nocardia seriolae]MTJ61471.1 DeoR family transcriptional regulator [Nocardia seriolae]MTJ71676.1 DeoR family transcriptional regulator [Nocardia seriolae]MTJ86503.1 DeoR family transcriptional regulator [Nocardia seriolae]MTK30496.1 DeoR family transcriptional regulator [Nocardia seriolae]
MTAPADRPQRWNRLLELLAESGRLSVEEAAERLGVSTATVRRDFTALADQQLATRTHGGIVATAVAYDLPARYRHGDRARERIAEHTAALVDSSAVVGLNGGTTTTAVARALAGRTDPSAAEDEQLTIVTNALNIAAELVLRPHLRTICLGGMARRESYELHGPLAERALAELRMNTVVLGVNAISAEGGAQCRHLDEAGVSTEMVRRAEQTIVATTSDKLVSTALARICPIEAVHVLVTDTDADPETVAAIRAAGTRVDLV